MAYLPDLWRSKLPAQEKKTLAFVLCMSLAASQLTIAAGAENSRTPADLEPAVIKSKITEI